MFKRICVAAIVFIIGLQAYASEDYPFVRAQTFEDAWKASCRVCVDGARGSGTHVGGIANVAAYVMTNYHVVTKNDSARLDFWTNGKMESVRGVVVWRAYNAQEAEDFATIAVRVDELKKINPPWIALGGSDARPSVGAIVVSSGAPDGRFPQAWKGQILEYYRGETAIFSPPPVPGQSGSAICEYVDGELFVTGILTWLIGEKGRDDSKGGAIPVANIYKALEKRGTNVDFHDDASPIPPGAQECSEPVGPCVLEFTQTNCPPCKDAETDVAQLRAFGVDVYVYDVATERGSEYVKRYGIDRTPSFVLLDKSFKPVETFIGAGKVDEIRTRFDSLKIEARENDVAADEPLPDARENATQTSPSTPINLPLLVPIESATDFRNRPPVYEVSDDVGFFDDSDRRWQDLKRRNKDDAEKGEEDEEKRPRLGERITDGAVEAFASRVEKRIDGKVAEVKISIRQKWDAVKYRATMVLCFLIVVAVIVAEGFVALAKWIWRKTREKATLIASALEAVKNDAASPFSSHYSDHQKSRNKNQD